MSHNGSVVIEDEQSQKYHFIGLVYDRLSSTSRKPTLEEWVKLAYETAQALDHLHTIGNAYKITIEEIYYCHKTQCYKVMVFPQKTPISVQDSIHQFGQTLWPLLKGLYQSPTLKAMPHAHETMLQDIGLLLFKMRQTPPSVEMTEIIQKLEFLQALLQPQRGP